MQVLHHLKPEKVFYYFEKICSIPHGSNNTKKISDYLTEFARGHTLDYYQDEFNNVIIKKPATIGYENSKTVILQGHIDMVCVKTTECTKNMETDGLDLVIDGDYIYAENTSLGGDDGIAVAMILAILSSNDIPHPSLEAVFTSDEEIGMIGAQNLDTSNLSGKILLNIDSEEEGVLIVSCAGGSTTECILPINREDEKSETIEIKISGLVGGHSGSDITLQRANSNVLLGRVLNTLNTSADIRIVEINGGTKYNVIPSESSAVIVCDNLDMVNTICENCLKTFQDEFKTVEHNINLKIIQRQKFEYPLDKDSSDKAIAMLVCLPNGVINMSYDIPNFAQTSLNMGILKTDTDKITATFCIRSNVNSEKEMLTQKVVLFMKMINGYTDITSSYSAWEYNDKSVIKDIISEVYKDLFGKFPKVESMHAGVECGIFSEKITEPDCISFGPDILNIHSVQEKLSISSTERVFNMLLETLKRLK